MLFNVVMVLIALFAVWETVRAIRTGEVSAKRTVIRRSESPVWFYLAIGGNLFFVAFVLWMLFV